MKPQLIVMLTHDDKTVENAKDVFETCKDLPVKSWGFKDVGLSPDRMKELISAMKDTGKSTYLEIVSYSMEECLAGAKLAVEYQFDYLMGTIFYQEVWDYLQSKHMNYYPFVGDIHGSPSILEGSVESMIEQTEFFESVGINGVDLLAFRHTGNPEELARDFVKKSRVPVVLAGSIDSFKRIEFVNSVSPQGFTIGSALFNKSFEPEGSFRVNLETVIDKMNSLD